MDVDLAAVLQHGGFALAALVFGSMLIYVLRTGREFMVTREGFIDRLLTRLERTEAEHTKIVDHLDGLLEGSKATAESLKQVQITLSRLNGRGGS